MRKIPMGAPVGLVALLAGVVSSAGAQDAGILLPATRARIYAKPSRDVWNAARHLAKDLGLATDTDDSHQLISMWWQPFLRSETEGFRVLPRRADGQTQQQFQLHLFVSPFAEPAHVYVDSVVLIGMGVRSGVAQLTYGSEEVSAWFFNKLEERLAERGRPMPRDPAERARLAESLGGPPPCAAHLRAEATGAGAVARPRAISRPEPIYPRTDLLKGREAVITVEAALAEDGAVHSAHAHAGPDQAAMVRAAEAAVTLGRYEPARAQGCAVPSVMEVRVSFKHR